MAQSAGDALGLSAGEGKLEVTRQSSELHLYRRGDWEFQLHT